MKAFKTTKTFSKSGCTNYSFLLNYKGILASGYISGSTSQFYNSSLLDGTEKDLLATTACLCRGPQTQIPRFLRSEQIGRSSTLSSGLPQATKKDKRAVQLMYIYKTNYSYFISLASTQEPQWFLHRWELSQTCCKGITRFRGGKISLDKFSLQIRCTF